MESKYAYWIGLAGLVIVALILLFRPLPTSEGAYCDEDCTYKVVNPTDMYGNFTAAEICGPGCLIKSVEYDVAHGWIVKCECCDCVLVGGDMGLPDCKSSGVFGYVYSWLGWCEFKT